MGYRPNLDVINELMAAFPGSIIAGESRHNFSRAHIEMSDTPDECIVDLVKLVKAAGPSQAKYVLLNLFHILNPEDEWCVRTMSWDLGKLDFLLGRTPVITDSWKVEASVNYDSPEEYLRRYIIPALSLPIEDLISIGERLDGLQDVRVTLVVFALPEGVKYARAAGTLYYEKEEV